MTDLEKAARQALEWMWMHGQHDRNCDVLDLDEHGHHGECTCGFDSSFTALRRALEQPSIPQGWMLVPVEPTFKMIDAGAEDLKLRGLHRGYLVGANECYAAMLNAAPTPPKD